MVIRPTRSELSRSFPGLGFELHSDQQPRWFEVALATEARLFSGSEKSRRSPLNFFTTRGHGLLTFARGEALYLVPPEVLARFAGNDHLYYAVALYDEPILDKPSAVFVPNGSPQSIRISKSFTGVSRRLTTRPASDHHRDYSGADPKAINWGGDALANTPPAPAARPPAPSTASALDFIYDDGHGAMPVAVMPVVPDLPAPSTATLDDQFGVDGPVPDLYDSVVAVATPLEDAPVAAGAPADAGVGTPQVKVSTLKVWLNAFIPEAGVTVLGSCYSGDKRSIISGSHSASRMHA